MRISTKEEADRRAPASSAECILGAYGCWRYQREETDLKLAAERDFRMLRGRRWGWRSRTRCATGRPPTSADSRFTGDRRARYRRVTRPRSGRPSSPRAFARPGGVGSVVALAQEHALRPQLAGCALGSVGGHLVRPAGRPLQPAHCGVFPLCEGQRTAALGGCEAPARLMVIRARAARPAGTRASV